jgi:hypothetical protein
MEYSWKIESVDEVTNTMTVKYTFNTSYPMEPILVNMARCPAGVNVGEHVRNNAPVSKLDRGGKFNASATTGLQGYDSVYVESIMKMDSISLDDYKKLKLEELAAKRYEFETSGLDLGGTKIDTSRSSQAILTAAYISLKNNLIQSVDWKDESGTFVTLSLAEIEVLSTAVSVHVQQAFTKEKDLTALVLAAGTKAEVDTIVW